LNRASPPRLLKAIVKKERLKPIPAKKRLQSSLVKLGGENNHNMPRSENAVSTRILKHFYAKVDVKNMNAFLS
jgi:hypothetical protein